MVMSKLPWVKEVKPADPPPTDPRAVARHIFDRYVVEWNKRKIPLSAFPNLVVPKDKEGRKKLAQLLTGHVQELMANHGPKSTPANITYTRTLEVPEYPAEQHKRAQQIADEVFELMQKSRPAPVMRTAAKTFRLSISESHIVFSHKAKIGDWTHSIPMSRVNGRKSDLSSVFRKPALGERKTDQVVTKT